MSDAPIPPLARALGRIPSGLFVVTTGTPDGPLGFVASLVQQVGFEPPTVSVAIAKGRDHLAAIRASGSFAVSVLDQASGVLMGPFFKPHADGSSPFEGLAVQDAPSGAPVLTDALAWVDCRVTGEHATGDHVLVFGVAETGELLREGDPSCHTRKDGRGY
jgi:flavin reductase (DIM6/NTAB) family NADH-FMN oxidoreductase RutF